jgi:porin
MAISPMPRGHRSGFGKLAVISGFALILFMLILPAFAFAGDPPAAADPAVILPDPDPQGSVLPPPVQGGMSFMHQDYMLNWGPERQRLAEKGFTFNFHYITDAVGDVKSPAGVPERFGNWQRIRGTVDYDFGKSTELKGLLFHATGVWQNGVNMGAVIGSIANFSGIVSSHQFRLDSINLTQKLAKDKFEISAGIMAAQDLYGLQTYIGSFVNEPMFYNFGNMGNVRASYDPESGPAADIKFIPSKRFFVRTGWFAPSDDGEEHTYPTGFNYSNGHHGSTWDTEADFFTDPDAPATRKSYPGVLRFGFIYNGSQASSTLYPACLTTVPSGCGGFTNYGSLVAVAPGVFAPTQVNGNYTFYFQANQPVYRVTAGSSRGLDLTFGFNIGPQNKSEVPTEFTAGGIFRAPFASRPKDSLAVGLVYSKIGSDYNTFLTLNGLPSLNDEKLIEVNYLIQVFPWFTFQPVYQYYSSVGGTNTAAALAGFRVITVF